MVMNNLPMKRGRDQFDGITAVANCLVLLSRHHAAAGYFSSYATTTTSSNAMACGGGRVFECKTCNRQFPSFQALGGHRASHKRPKLPAMEPTTIPSKPRTHECSICGQEFSIGQALGGHMRRHRSANSDGGSPPAVVETATSESSGSGDGRGALWLDLNLTPLENDLESKFVGNKLLAAHNNNHHHVVDCYL